MKRLIFLFSLTLLVATSCKKEDGDDPIDGNKPAITLDCSTISDDMVLANDPDAAVDYIVPCVINITGNVTVEPGTVIQFQSDAGFQVNGSFKAIGNSSSPIIMEGETAVPGSWRGIIFFSNDVNNILEYTTVRHAGGNSFNSNGDLGNVIVYAQGRLTMRNCTLSDGEAYGLRINYGDCKLTFENNQINDCGDAPLLIPAYLAHELDAASSFTGNALQQLEIGTDYIEESVTWIKAALPYRIVNRTAGQQIWVRNGGQLVLSPGVTMSFESDLGIRVNDDATFRFIGTATEPITFSGATSAPGAWKGMINYSNDPGNAIDYAVFEYAGSGAFTSNGDVGTIILWANSQLTLTNSTLRDSDGSCGIVASYSGTSLTESNNTFTNVGTPICN